MQDRVLTAVDVHRDALAKQQAASASQIATAVQETQAARRELQEVEAAWAAAARGLENERNLRVYTEGLLREEQEARAELLEKDAAFLKTLTRMRALEVAPCSAGSDAVDGSTGLET